MSNERPQTPRAELGFGSQALPVTPSTTRSYFDRDIWSLAQTPELGLDVTPLSNNYNPSTPSDVLFIHNTCTGTRLQHSPSKPYTTGNVIDSLPDVVISHYEDPVKIEDHLHPDEINTTSTGWLFKRDLTTTIIDTKEERQSKHDIAMNLDPYRIDTNFSSPNASPRRGRSASVPRTHTQQATATLNQQTPSKEVPYDPKVMKSSVSAEKINVPALTDQHTIFKKDQAVHKAVQFGAQLSSSLATHNENLARILRYDTMQRLFDEPRRCVSSLKKAASVRCRHHSKWTQEDTDELCNDICRLHGPLNITTAMPFIDRIIGRAICNSGKHRLAAECQLEKLLNCIAHDIAIISGTCPKGTPTLSPMDLDAVPGWIAAVFGHATISERQLLIEKQPFETQGNISTPCGVQHKLSHQSTTQAKARQGMVKQEFTPTPLVTSGSNSSSKQRASSISNDNASSTVPDLYGTAIGQTFVPFTLAKEYSGLAIECVIRKVLTKPLGPVDDRKEGYIYMYWTRGNFGHTKIGVTTGKPEARLKRWKTQCGHDIQSHELLGSGTRDSELISIPHVYRVERLVHTELHRYRLKEIQCGKCGVAHDEWFKVDPELAKKVIAKWSQWMRTTQPYVVSCQTAINDCSKAEIVPNKLSRETKSDTVAKKVDPPVMQLKASITPEEITSMCTLVEDTFLKTPKTHEKRQIRSRSTPGLRRSSRLASKRPSVGKTDMEFDTKLLATDVIKDVVSIVATGLDSNTAGNTHSLQPVVSQNMQQSLPGVEVMG